MNVIKRFSVMALTAISMSLGAGNFGLVNSNPKTPVYYSINNGVLKGLGGAHIGEIRTVKKGQDLQIIFSAKADGSNPTYFAFVPGQKTCFIQVHVGRDGKIVINPQTTVKPTAIKCTKARCAVKAKPSSTHNITQQEIDQIQAQAQALAAYSAAPVAAAAAAPAPADDDLALAIARSLEDQKQAVPAPAPRDEDQAAPAPDEDQAAPAPAPRDEKQDASGYDADLAIWRESQARDLAPQQQDNPAKLPSYDEALEMVNPQADMAAHAEPAPVVGPVTQPKAQDAETDEPEAIFQQTSDFGDDSSDIENVEGQTPVAPVPVVDQPSGPIVELDADTDDISDTYQQPSDFADESSDPTRNLVAAPVPVEPAAPVAQPEQPAELVELAAAAAAPAQDAVVEEHKIESLIKFSDPIVIKLEADHKKDITYRLAASNILEFFQQNEVIGAWLNKAKANNNFDGLAKLIKNLIQPNKEAFNAAVRDIMGIQSDGFISDRNCIDFIFNRIMSKHTPVANEKITASIVELYKTQPDFVDNNRDNLSELLTQWENHLQHNAPNVAAIWQELKPLSKIYYLKLITFYFEAQSTLEGMSQAAPQQ